MTMNKRFTVDEHLNIIDNKEQIVLDGGEDAHDMLDLLNELNDENEHLKSKLSEKSIQLDYLQSENKQMSDVLNENKQLKQQLQQFQNITIDYHIPFDEITEAFDELIEKNTKLTSQIKKYEKTLISSIQSERTSLGGNVLKNLADNLEIKY